MEQIQFLADSKLTATSTRYHSHGRETAVYKSNQIRGTVLNSIEVMKKKNDKNKITQNNKVKECEKKPYHHYGN